MAILKQSTAYTRTFLMVQSSDHITGITGATVAVKLSKAGAAGGAAAGAVSEVDATNNPGLYKIALTTADTGTIGDLAFHCTATSADPADFVDQVCANILGDTLPANVTQWSGTNVSAPSTAGIPEVNIKNIANAAVSATTAQLGVNVVNWNNTVVATPATAGIPDINVKNIANAVVNTANAQIGVNIVNVKGSASAGAAGYMGLDWSAINAPTTAQGLTGTTISTSQVVASVSGAVGSVTGAVGSVTGAVGSVTGNVGGNVVGSVASVSGAVGSVTAAVATTSNVKKNAISNGFLFVMTDATTHAPKTGLTVSGTVSIDGGGFGALTNAVSEVANGTYVVNLAAADVNGNHLMLRFTASGADDCNILLVTQP